VTIEQGGPALISDAGLSQPGVNRSSSVNQQRGEMRPKPPIRHAGINDAVDLVIAFGELFHC
jgi:hypothetical protein